VVPAVRLQVARRNRQILTYFLSAHRQSSYLLPPVPRAEAFVDLKVHMPQAHPALGRVLRAEGRTTTRWDGYNRLRTGLKAYRFGTGGVSYQLN
jgi:hypothetical protein